jgi:hypothetical protein
MRLPEFLVASILFSVGFVLPVAVQASDAIQWRNPLQPCDGDCAVTVFTGTAVATNVQDIFFKPIGPTAWHYSGGGIVGGTMSRRIATAFRVFDIEAEAGVAKRFGDQTEGEVWGALYVRITDFPWNNYLYTTFAVSTGLNYATGISDFEKEMSGLNPPGGTHVLHYFSPEFTFAMPDHKERQLVVRLHHRSGAYGVVSGAFSGATYLTVGLRLWF